MKSKATIVSIVPFELVETKATVQPNVYTIKAPKNVGDFEVTEIEDAITFLAAGDKVVEIPVPVSQLADSLINDYCGSQLAADAIAKPGLFWVSGVHTKEDIRKNFSAELKSAFDRQSKWFRNLYTMAQDDWAEHHQLRRISDLQRQAAQFLGLKPEWLSLPEPIKPKNCPFCTKAIPEAASICPECKSVVDPTKHAQVTKALGVA